MFKQTMKRTGPMWRVVAALLFSLFCALSASAQPADSPYAVKQELPEEIVIIGQRSMTQLRIELKEAELDAYNVFNQFNDDKRFNISCSVSARTGSHFTRQVCQAEFEIQAMRGHAQDYLNTMPGSPGDGRPPQGSVTQQYPPVEAGLQQHQKAYKEKMRQIAEEHPEFLDAIARYAALNQE